MGRVPDRGTGRVQRHQHIGAAVFEALELADGPPELQPDRGVVGRRAQSPVRTPSGSAPANSSARCGERVGNRLANLAPVDNYPTTDAPYVCLVAGSDANLARRCAVPGTALARTLAVADAIGGLHRAPCR